MLLQQGSVQQPAAAAAVQGQISANPQVQPALASATTHQPAAVQGVQVQQGNQTNGSVQQPQAIPPVVPGNQQPQPSVMNRMANPVAPQAQVYSFITKKRLLPYPGLPT